MSTHEKKPRVPRNTSSTPTSHNTNSKSSSHTASSIATPPRAALRFKPNTSNASADPTPSPDSASITSITSTPDTEDSLLEHNQQLLSERESQISILQNELRTMEDEFERELTTLSHKLTSESETGLFWREKHALLHQALLKTDSELRSLKQEHSHCPHNSQTREDVSRDLRTRIASLTLDRDAFREAYNEAMGELRGHEEEVKGLREQVRGLKSWVSSSGRMEEQVADGVFAEGWRRLGNGVQNWVIVNFRKVRIELTPSSTPTSILPSHICASLQNLTTTSSTLKIHVIQSIIAHYFVTHIFSTYYFGLEKEQEDDLRRVERCLGACGSTEELNSWRASTLSILRRSSGGDLPSSSLDTTTSTSSTTPAISNSLATHSNDLITTLNKDVSTLLSSLTPTPLAASMTQSLLPLINQAIGLSRLLRVQRAVFSVLNPLSPLSSSPSRSPSQNSTPHPNPHPHQAPEENSISIYDPSQMENIGTEEEEEEEESDAWEVPVGGGAGGMEKRAKRTKHVTCVVWPGLKKSGDERGGNMELVNVVVRARVLCEDF